MLDGVMRRLLDPVLDQMGRRAASFGLGADAVTLAGFTLGLLCSVCVASGWNVSALLLLGLGRIADGLDGAVARATRPTDRGGYLDITCDFIFYGSLPLAFALRDPVQFALPSAVLLATFYANGASFLAYAAVAARRGLRTDARGPKSLYFTTGLMEGSETIAFFAAFILWPHHYPFLAYLFAALCLVTCLARIGSAYRLFGEDDGSK